MRQTQFVLVVAGATDGAGRRCPNSRAEVIVMIEGLINFFFAESINQLKGRCKRQMTSLSGLGKANKADDVQINTGT